MWQQNRVIAAYKLLTKIKFTQRLFHGHGKVKLPLIPQKEEK